jgi:hypothetical protein
MEQESRQESARRRGGRDGEKQESIKCGGGREGGKEGGTTGEKISGTALYVSVSYGMEKADGKK